MPTTEAVLVGYMPLIFGLIPISVSLAFSTFIANNTGISRADAAAHIGSITSHTIPSLTANQKMPEEA